MFLPTTREEIIDLGWEKLDIILVTGDAYIDSPFIGVAVIGKILVDAGYRIGVIAQPDMENEDIRRLGEPELFWGVTGGCIDSMVANRTASGKKRKTDDYTPGGFNNRRPDRAALVYSNLIRQHFKNTRPIVLGGIEASLRRIAHYDYWSNKIRKSILIDSKADYLLYGMADRSVVELADAMQKDVDPRSIDGMCHVTREPCSDCIVLPSYDEVVADKNALAEMFTVFYQNNDPISARPLAQKQDNRYLIQNPPAASLSTDELDTIHDLAYERDLHPYYKRFGDVRALETIRFSIATHRGCYGECNFCAIAVHQGRTVRWRSKKSILREAKTIADHPSFKGTIHDVGGPTANMYGFECDKKLQEGSCAKKRCLYPKICPKLVVDHGPQVQLLKALRQVKGVRKVVVASGIRYDMILADRKNGLAYLRDIIKYHVSGQLKIAPEHSEKSVLAKMGKPGVDSLLRFMELFYSLTKKAGLKQYLTYYMIAAHPGCTRNDMEQLKLFCRNKLKVMPRQIQVFTPTPSTYSTLMYCTGMDPFSGKPCCVEKSVKGREEQKKVLLQNTSRPRKKSSSSRLFTRRKK